MLYSRLVVDFDYALLMGFALPFSLCCLLVSLLVEDSRCLILTFLEKIVSHFCVFYGSTQLSLVTASLHITFFPILFPLLDVCIQSFFVQN